MKKVGIIFCLLIFGISNGIAQENYNLDWLILEDDIDTGSSAFYSEPKIIYDSSSSSIYVFDNTYLVYFEMRCTKYSSEGEKLWSFIYNRSIQSDLFVDAQLDSEGNIIFFGTTELHTGAQPPEHLIRSTSLLKLNPDGDVLWRFENKLEDGFLYDTRTLFVDSEDNIYISGWKRPWPTGAQEAYLNKYNPTGELEWQKTGFPNGIRAVYEIDGLIGLVGFTSGSAAYFSRKYTKEGSLVTSHYSTIDVTDSYLGSPGIVTRDGGYIRGSNAYGYEVQKFNHEGQVVWSYQKEAQDSIAFDWVDKCRFLMEDNTQNSYGVGIYSFTNENIKMVMTKIDPYGNMVWEVIVDGDGGMTSPKEGFQLRGEYLYVTLSYSNEGEPFDFGLMKYNLDGQLIYKSGRISAESIGLVHRLWPNGLVVDSNEDIFLIGDNSVPSLKHYMTILKYHKEPTAVETIAPNTPLILSPNPAASIVRLTVDERFVNGNKAATVLIYDMLGHLVSKSKTMDLQDVIQVSHLSAGSYIVELHWGDKKFRGKLEKI